MPRLERRGGNAFGLANDLNLVAVEPSTEGTILTWDEYYDGAELSAMHTVYDDAFADSAARLIARVGRHVFERSVVGPGVR